MNEIFTREQFLVLKLSYTILLIVSETDPGRPRGKCKAKAVYLIRFPGLLTAHLPSGGIR